MEVEQEHQAKIELAMVVLDIVRRLFALRIYLKVIYNIIIYI